MLVFRPIFWSWVQCKTKKQAEFDFSYTIYRLNKKYVEKKLRSN